MKIVNTIKFFLSIILAAGYLHTSAWAGTNTGADFLKLPIGAHSVGLGQATTAGLKGVDALNWNPAGITESPVLGGTRMMGMSFSHQQLFTDNNLDQFGFTKPFSNMTVGINLMRVTYLEQEARGQDRALSGHFTPSDTVVGFTVATRLNSLSVGSQVKWISEKLASEQAASTAIDLGLLTETPIRQLTLGASMKNLGGQMRFISDSYNLPLTFSVGGVYKLSSPFSLALDLVNRPYQHQTSLAFGAELNTSSALTLRAGYLAKLAESITDTQKSETNRGNIAGIGGLSAGMGIRLHQFRLDYAFAPYGELGASQIITLSTYFSSYSSSEKSKGNSQKTIAPKKDIPQRQIIIFDANPDAPFVPSQQDQIKP